MGVENAIFSYGGDLGDYAPTRSTASSKLAAEPSRALKFYKRLYGYTPPDWGKTSSRRATRPITEKTWQRMSMELLSGFFPALATKRQSRTRKVTGYFAMPKSPTGSSSRREAARAFRSSPNSKNKEVR